MPIPTFVPKAVHYPVAGKNEILVSGEVDGEVRNAPLIEDAELAQKYRDAEATKAAAIKVATDDCTKTRTALDEIAQGKAVELFIEAHTPTPAVEE